MSRAIFISFRPKAVAYYLSVISFIEHYKFSGGIDISSHLFGNPIAPIFQKVLNKLVSGISLRLRFKFIMENLIAKANDVKLLD